ncbi:MAG: hypothetical protein ACR2O2_01740 [Ruegeria sp.]
MADNETELDLLFANAAKDRGHLPDELAVRMMTDAETVRLERIRQISPAPDPLWRQILDGVGGWQGMGGLVAACAAGVWIGFAAPEFLPDPADFINSQETNFLVAELDLDTVYLEDGQ